MASLYQLIVTDRCRGEGVCWKNIDRLEQAGEPFSQYLIEQYDKAQAGGYQNSVTFLRLAFGTGGASAVARVDSMVGSRDPLDRAHVQITLLYSQRPEAVRLAGKALLGWDGDEERWPSMMATIGRYAEMVDTIDPSVVRWIEDKEADPSLWMNTRMRAYETLDILGVHGLAERRPPPADVREFVEGRKVKAREKLRMAERSRAIAEAEAAESDEEKRAHEAWIQGQVELFEKIKRGEVFVPHAE